MKYYDPGHRRLICTAANASERFWDSHWNVDSGIRDQLLRQKNSFVSCVTRRYLVPDDGMLLEGGCGKGQNVASLVANGYRCVGVDYAEETIASLKRYVPELDFRLGDVDNLPFADGSFSGYWSLGVIEHYWDGYGSIASEMIRVIKPNGYLFLSFPYMSPLRRFKANMDLYRRWDATRPEGFYQFILPKESVVTHFEERGFSHVESIPYDGIKGLKDEVGFLRPVLQRLYDYKGGRSSLSYMRHYLSQLFQPVASHCVLLVMKRS